MKRAYLLLVAGAATVALAVAGGSAAFAGAPTTTPFLSGQSPAAAKAVTPAAAPLAAEPLAAAAAAATGPTLPTGFIESTVFSGLSFPTAVRFSPDGRVFVAEKSGVLLEYDSLSDSTPTVVVDLSNEVDDYWDRGLLGLALDPNFPATPYIYLLYTYDAPIGGTAPVWNDACPTPPGPTTDGCSVSGRLVRIQLSGNVMTGSENVLINDWCQQYPSHSIGDLVFGPDGDLYVSGGEGASFTFADYGQGGGSAGSPTPANVCGDPPGGVGGAETPPTAEGGALRAQSLNRPAGQPVLLNGSILRIDPATGLGLPTNPNGSSTNANARRIIADGLRNPFRFTFRPGTNEVWAGDVGNDVWEEIDRIPNPTASTVTDFGWPCYEGVAPQPAYQSAGLNICTKLYNTAGSVTAPYYTYQHGVAIVPGENCLTANGSSISGLAFYTGGSYPASYNGALFFADHTRNCIWVMLPGSNGLPDPTKIQNFVQSALNPVDLETGPGGDLFYVNYDLGTVERITYAGGGGGGGSPPAISTPPTISGAAQQGQTLTASTGTWSGSPTSYAYQWQRCTNAGVGCQPVSGATAATYVLAPADAGQTVAVAVTATNGSGPSVPAQSAVTAVVSADMALGKTATASSSYSSAYLPGLAVDGDSTTRWSSSFSDAQWWQVDLGSAQSVSSVSLNWEAAYPSSYKIQLSTDGTTFTDAATVSISQPGVKATSFATTTARYVRVLGVTRATVYGISFFDANVYGPVTATVVPVPTIDTPLSTLTYKVGDPISFTGHATETGKGTLPASTLSWTEIIHHCPTPTTCHVHLVQTWTGVASGSFNAPDHDWPSWLELQLTATDPAGATATTSVLLQPQTVALTFTSNPSGLSLAVGSSASVTPFTRTVIINSAQSISATTPQTLNGTSYAFSSWSDGGAATHNITSPATATTYSVAYQAQAGSPVPVNSVLPSVSGSTQVGQTMSASTGSWSGSPTSYAYQWQRCTSAGTGCAAITGAAAATYVLATADVGKTVAVSVIASNGSGASQAALSAASAVVSAVSTDLALGKTATASSSYSSAYLPGLAVDGNSTTRWSSSFSDAQWWQVDLGSAQSVSSVSLNWEAAYASSYKIQLSTDGTTFTTVATVSISQPGVKATSFTATTARYVRVLGVTRATVYGISFFDANVFGSSGGGGGGSVPVNSVLPSVSGSTQVGQTMSASTGSWSGSPTSYAYQWQRCTSAGTGCAAITGAAAATYVLAAADVGKTVAVSVIASNGSGASQAALSAASAVVSAVSTDLALGKTATASSSYSSAYLPGLAVDGNSTTRWSSSFSDAQWWQVDLGSAQSVSSVSLNWEAAYASSYKIQLSTDGTTFTTVATVSISQPGVKATSFTATTARYVRVLGVTRATVYGISFFDANVFH